MSTPVVGLVPDAILQSPVTVERSSSASVKSAPVISTFESKKALIRFAFEKFTFRRLAFWNLTVFVNDIEENIVR